MLRRHIYEMGHWHSLDATVLHVADELPGNFFEHLLGQVPTHHCLVEPDKLHDIALARLTIAVAQTTTVAIELLHGVEVGITNTNDNDGAGQLSQLVDLIDRLIHVVDGAVGQNEQNGIGVAPDERLHVLAELAQDGLEIRGA